MQDAMATSGLSLEALYTSFTCGSLRLANRFVMSPMTRDMSPGNLLNPEAPAYYARRAAGGCALVVTEGTAIPHPVAHATSTIPNFYGDSLAGWQETARAVHANGGAIFAQLWHTGLYRSREETLNPQMPSIAPSAIGEAPVRVMTEEDIADVIDAYATAAANARSIGFDGIEIHGAHGYLPDQFFWPPTNKRADRYGGPIENRVRFAVEMVAEIRRRTAPDFPIMFRFSQWKGLKFDAKVARDPTELEAWLCPLADAGVDIFDASTRRFWVPEFEGSDMNLAGWAKRVTGKASMTVGSVGLESPLHVGKVSESNGVEVSTENLSRLVQMFERGDFDLVALGRIILSNPDWPTLVRQERFDAIRPYDPAIVAARLECAAA
ncbi:oxidoreductase [Flavisphingomonas formosensis]|uniref:oxidoreductase n=1 Tax=Flavisphingomonas formosensis TaxID=861534 RepID=UPI001E3CC078|nr:12-oxophytodienoate reductase [Sphingomonas formosensis]